MVRDAQKELTAAQRQVDRLLASLKPSVAEVEGVAKMDVPATATVQNHGYRVQAWESSAEDIAGRGCQRKQEASGIGLGRFGYRGCLAPSSVPFLIRVSGTGDLDRNHHFVEVLVLPLFASPLQPQDINLADIGCPRGMIENMEMGQCTASDRSMARIRGALAEIEDLTPHKINLNPRFLRQLAHDSGDNASLSFKFFLLSALLGDAESQFIVGGMYSNGKGTEEDDMESLRWLHESAHGGYRKAQVRLAYMLSKGEFVEKNDVEAVHWLKRARKSGRPTLAKNTGI